MNNNEKNDFEMNNNNQNPIVPTDSQNNVEANNTNQNNQFNPNNQNGQFNQNTQNNQFDPNNQSYYNNQFDPNQQYQNNQFNQASNYYVNEQLMTLRSMKTMSIVTIVLCLIVIGLFIALIMNIVYAIKIMSTKWAGPATDESKTLWGLLTLLLLGPIASLVFACNGISELSMMQR